MAGGEGRALDLEKPDKKVISFQYSVFDKSEIGLQKK
jgi:hypothetical protein